MVIECPAMTYYRNSCGIGKFIRALKLLKPQISSIKLYALLLSDRDPEKMNEKALDLYHMYVDWHSLMNINI